MNALQTNRRFSLRALAHGLASGATLLPRGVAATVAACGGRSDRAWRLLLGRPSEPGAELSDSEPGKDRVAWCALATIPLGGLSLLLVGMELLFVARGLLYGLVDHGPYDASWGGPTRAGAWAVHLVVSLPFALLGLWLLSSLAHLHRRVVARLTGSRGGAWVLPTAVVACAAGALFFVSWLHQL